MNKQRNKLVKSRSSDYTLEVKNDTQKNNKKRRKNAEIQPGNTITIRSQDVQPKILKKLGVYLEKKMTDVPVSDLDQNPINVPPRKHVSCPNRLSPWPGRKGFETSMPTDLSKSAIKSQWTNNFENIRKLGETKNKPKLTGNKKENHEQSNTSPNILKRKSRCKYKDLKDHINAKLQPIDVLQSITDIAQTGHNNTNNENGLLETYQPKSKAISKMTRKGDKNVIRTEVNETGDSFNYLVKEFSNQQLPKNPNHSKVPLEILANQLDLHKVNKRELQTFDRTQKPSPKHSDSIRADEREECNKQLLKSVQPQLSKPHKVPKSPLPQKSSKIQSDSSQHKKTAQLKPKTSKATKKTTSKNCKKERVEENFYGALKILAKNKKLNQTIVVNDQPKRRREVLPTESIRKQHVNHPKHSISNPKQSINNPKQTINNHKQSINYLKQLLIYPKQFIDYPQQSISYSKKIINCPKSRFRKSLVRQESFLSTLPYFPKAPISAVEYYETNLNRSDSETSDYINQIILRSRK